MTVEQLTGQVPGGRKFYHQLLELQDALFRRAMNDKAEDTEAAACARAWEVLEERKRIMRGKLKPGSINETRKADAGSRKERRRISNAIVLPVQAEVRQIELGKESTNPAGVPVEPDNTTSPESPS